MHLDCGLKGVSGGSIEDDGEGRRWVRAFGRSVEGRRELGRVLAKPSWSGCELRNLFAVGVAVGGLRLCGLVLMKLGRMQLAVGRLGTREV